MTDCFTLQNLYDALGLGALFGFSFGYFIGLFIDRLGAKRWVRLAVYVVIAVGLCVYLAKR